MLPQFLVHIASVETYLGATPTGDGYAAPVDVTGFLDEGGVLVKTPQGEERVEQTKWYCRIADAAKFVPESRVIVNGRECQVTKVRRREAGSAWAAVEHLEVDLT